MLCRLNTLWLAERAAAAGSHRHSNNCEKLNCSCLSPSVWRIRGWETYQATGGYARLSYAPSTGAFQTVVIFNGWLMPICHFSDICTASSDLLYTAFSSYSSFVVFAFFLRLFLNLIRMTCLTFIIPPLCYILFPVVGYREQSEVDRMFVLVWCLSTPLWYWCGIMGPGTQEAQRETEEWEAKEIYCWWSFQSEWSLFWAFFLLST